MYIISNQYSVIVLFIQIYISYPTDIALHYPNRVTRCEYDPNYNTASTLTQIFSLFMFVLYILIVLGLIKGCLGLCCSREIGLQGLHLLTNNPDLIITDEEKVNEGKQPNIFHRNTEFCLNVVFFLVLPVALIVKICKQPYYLKGRKTTVRLPAGAEIIQTNIESKNSIADLEKKKSILDVYRDGNDSETQDTKYVLEQLHRSEQSLKSGEYISSFLPGKMDGNN